MATFLRYTALEAAEAPAEYHVLATRTQRWKMSKDIYAILPSKCEDRTKVIRPISNVDDAVIARLVALQKRGKLFAYGCVLARLCDRMEGVSHPCTCLGYSRLCSCAEDRLGRLYDGA